MCVYVYTMYIYIHAYMYVCIYIYIYMQQADRTAATGPLATGRASKLNTSTRKARTATTEALAAANGAARA
jgi:hypothetical protein